MNNSWIYLAGPLFSAAEIAFDNELAGKLRDRGYNVFLPQEECAGLTDANEIYNTCLSGLGKAYLVLAILDGADADSGTCFEMGYARANDIPIIGLRTDFRGSGDDNGLNLMLTGSCKKIIMVTSNRLIDNPNCIIVKPGDDYLDLLYRELE